jgi:hypothetical protein
MIGDGVTRPRRQRSHRSRLESQLNSKPNADSRGTTTSTHRPSRGPRGQGWESVACLGGRRAARRRIQLLEQISPGSIPASSHVSLDVNFLTPSTPDGRRSRPAETRSQHSRGSTELGDGPTGNVARSSDSFRLEMVHKSVAPRAHPASARIRSGNEMQ